MLTKAPKGTKDVLPSQSYQWQYVESLFRDICKIYGFGEIRTPSFEHTELFVRGVGDTTDVVEKQMYSFNDYAGRNITLKPEGTSPAVRAFIENKLYAEMQPTKLSYITPCFRYENSQKGRLREFHQFGVEIFGTMNSLADAEVVSVASTLFEKLGITGLELRINSVGCPNCRTKHREALRAFLADKYDRLCNTCKTRYERNPMRILDCKSPECQELIKGAPLMLDYICDDCREHFESFKTNLDAMEIVYTIDPGIVRGLDYYTKTAFEFVSDKIGAQGTVCGGGRYDNLVEQLGGPETPGVGFGLGIERLLILLDETGIKLPDENRTEYMIVTMGDNAAKYGIALISRLRKKGKSVQMDMMGRNIKNQFKYADKIGAKYTLIIGDQELESNTVNLKNMTTGEQVSVGIDEIENL